jgi:hypothetical protein
MMINNNKNTKKNRAVILHAGRKHVHETTILIFLFPSANKRPRMKINTTRSTTHPRLYRQKDFLLGSKIVIALPTKNCYHDEKYSPSATADQSLKFYLRLSVSFSTVRPGAL